ncbi:MAG: ComF family protein [Patescibacteria group bacterium]
MHFKYRQIKKFILDLIFPVFCLSCNKEGQWLCENCLKKIEFKKPDAKREKGPGLDGLVVMADYKNEIVKQLIHLLKYNFAQDIRSALASLLAYYTKIYRVSFPAETLVIPVPLHKRRLRWRGFNQAQIIGEELAKIFCLNIRVDNLQRVRYTHPQVELSAAARKNNVKDAFFLLKPLEISGKSVILIDDVYTTGSTMKEATKVLKKAGAKEVTGFVIARG